MNSLIYDWKWKLPSFAKDTKDYISCLRISGKSRDIISFESDSRKSYKSHQVPTSAFPYLPISHLSESKQQRCIFQNPSRIQNLPCEAHIWLWGDYRILLFWTPPCIILLASPVTMHVFKSCRQRRFSSTYNLNSTKSRSYCESFNLIFSSRLDSSILI